MISALNLDIGKGEVAFSGGELRAQSFYPKVSRPKQQHSPQERKLHTSDHPALPVLGVGAVKKQKAEPSQPIS